MVCGVEMSQNHSHCHFRYAFDLLLNEHAHVSVPRSGRSDYMRGVIPPHEYTPVAKMCFHIHPGNRNPSLYNAVRSLIASTRAYTLVLLRLRAQAEKQAGMARTKPLYAPAPISPLSLLLLHLRQLQKSAPTAPRMEEVQFHDLPAVHPHLRHLPSHI